MVKQHPNQTFAKSACGSTMSNTSLLSSMRDIAQDETMTTTQHAPKDAPRTKRSRRFRTSKKAPKFRSQSRQNFEFEIEDVCMTLPNAASSTYHMTMNTFEPDNELIEPSEVEAQSCAILDFSNLCQVAIDAPTVPIPMNALFMGAYDGSNDQALGHIFPGTPADDTFTPATLDTQSCDAFDLGSEDDRILRIVIPRTPSPDNYSTTSSDAIVEASNPSSPHDSSDISDPEISPVTPPNEAFDFCATTPEPLIFDTELASKFTEDVLIDPPADLTNPDLPNEATDRNASCLEVHQTPARSFNHEAQDLDKTATIESNVAHMWPSCGEKYLLPLSSDVTVEDPKSLEPKTPEPKTPEPKTPEPKTPKTLSPASEKALYDIATIGRYVSPSGSNWADEIDEDVETTDAPLLESERSDIENIHLEQDGEVPRSMTAAEYLEDQRLKVIADLAHKHTVFDPLNNLASTDSWDLCNTTFFPEQDTISEDYEPMYEVRHLEPSAREASVEMGYVMISPETSQLKLTAIVKVWKEMVEEDPESTVRALNNLERKEKEKAYYDAKDEYLQHRDDPTMDARENHHEFAFQIASYGQDLCKIKELAAQSATTRQEFEWATLKTTLCAEFACMVVRGDPTQDIEDEYQMGYCTDTSGEHNNVPYQWYNDIHQNFHARSKHVITNQDMNRRAVLLKAAVLHLAPGVWEEKLIEDRESARDALEVSSLACTKLPIAYDDVTASRLRGVRLPYRRDFPKRADVEVCRSEGAWPVRTLWSDEFGCGVNSYRGGSMEYYRSSLARSRLCIVETMDDDEEQGPSLAEELARAQCEEDAPTEPDEVSVLVFESEVDMDSSLLFGGSDQCFDSDDADFSELGDAHIEEILKGLSRDDIQDIANYEVKAESLQIESDDQGDDQQFTIGHEVQNTDESSLKDSNGDETGSMAIMVDTIEEKIDYMQGEDLEVDSVIVTAEKKSGDEIDGNSVETAADDEIANAELDTLFDDDFLFNFHYDEDAGGMVGELVNCDDAEEQPGHEYMEELSKDDNAFKYSEDSGELTIDIILQVQEDAVLEDNPTGVSNVLDLATIQSDLNTVNEVEIDVARFFEIAEQVELDRQVEVSSEVELKLTSDDELDLAGEDEAEFTKDTEVALEANVNIVEDAEHALELGLLEHIKPTNDCNSTQGLEVTEESQSDEEIESVEQPATTEGIVPTDETVTLVDEETKQALTPGSPQALAQPEPVEMPCAWPEGITLIKPCMVRQFYTDLDSRYPNAKSVAYMVALGALVVARMRGWI